MIRIISGIPFSWWELSAAAISGTASISQDAPAINGVASIPSKMPGGATYKPKRSRSLVHSEVYAAPPYIFRAEATATQPRPSVVGQGCTRIVGKIAVASAAPGVSAEASIRILISGRARPKQRASGVRAVANHDLTPFLQKEDDELLTILDRAA